MKSIVNKINKVKYSGVVMAISMGMPLTVLADGTVGGSSGAGTNIMKTALDAIVGLFPLIGAVFVAAGAFKLINGFRNDNNPEAIAGGAKDLAIGAALITFDVLIWNSLSSVIF